MFPELFSIGPVTIHSYGLMVAVGVITAVWLADEIGRASCRERV